MLNSNWNLLSLQLFCQIWSGLVLCNKMTTTTNESTKNVLLFDWPIFVFYWFIYISSRVPKGKHYTTIHKLYNFVSVIRQTEICRWLGWCRGYASLRVQFVVVGQIVSDRGVDVDVWHLLLAWLMPFMLLPLQLSLVSLLLLLLLQTHGNGKTSVWFGLASYFLPDLKDNANERGHT